MATIHPTATIDPTKEEVLARFVPGQAWGVAGAEKFAAYRFDDPDGAVGMETFLLRAVDGQVLQVGLTYRDAPLPGGDDHLICTMEHSVLGRRWIYDACGDPAYARALASSLLERTPVADFQYEDEDGRLVTREPSVVVTSTGTVVREVPPVDVVVTASDAVSTTIEVADLRMIVRRRLDLPAPDVASEPALLGTWEGRADPAVLVYVD